MLTRLRVNNFKNLVDVDVRFGPLTVIVGANGVGKSNLFDAIGFLAALADHPVADAARALRDESGRNTDIHSLFHRIGAESARTMELETEMIIPRQGKDDFEQPVEAQSTLLVYRVVIGYRDENNARVPNLPEVLEESLTPVKSADAADYLLFPHTVSPWRKSVVRGRRSAPFISTADEDGQYVIRIHQPDNSDGKPVRRLPAHLPRTVLSSISTGENPTILMARREMQSWRLLHMEPSALRRPDALDAPPRLGVDGSHLPAVLYHLAHPAHPHPDMAEAPEDEARQIYSMTRNYSGQRVGDISSIFIERDEGRELLTLQATDFDRTVYPASALSEGTLRVLALGVLSIPYADWGLLCLEELENGIVPERIADVLQLLQRSATDVTLPVGPYNPLRQVIANTHSPAAASQAPEDSLLVAGTLSIPRNGKRLKGAYFAGLQHTWRDTAPGSMRPVGIGSIAYYVRPILPDNEVPQENGNGHSTGSPLHSSSAQRVFERPEIREYAAVAAEYE